MALTLQSFTINDTPEGFQGSLDEFLQFIAANLTLTIEGQFVNAQIGGERPLTNQGLFYISGRFLEIWDETSAKYIPPIFVPVGCVIPWASVGSVAPDNYLFCDGQLLLKADYGDLYNVVGTTWNFSGDDNTHFRLPDCRSRFVCFSGTGFVAPSLTATEKLIERIVGRFFGREDFTPLTPKYPGAPVSLGYGGSIKKGTASYTNVNPPALVMRALIRYR